MLHFFWSKENNGVSGKKSPEWTKIEDPTLETSVVWVLTILAANFRIESAAVDPARIITRIDDLQLTGAPANDPSTNII